MSECGHPILRVGDTFDALRRVESCLYCERDALRSRLAEAEALLREAEEREMNLHCQICGSVHFVARVADSAGEKP